MVRSRGGIPPGSGRGAVRRRGLDPPSAAAFPLDRARIYPVRSAKLWDAVNAVLDEHRFRFGRGRLDHEHGVAFPRWREVPSRRLPGFPETLDGATVEAFQLQAYVPRGVEPGRLYLASMAETNDLQYSRSNITFHAAVVHEWFFERVEARLGEVGVAMPQDSDDVWALLERMAPWAVDPRCRLDPVERLAHLEQVPASMREAHAAVRIPSSYTKPLFPHSSSRTEKTARVMVTGLLREDGSLSNLRALNVAGKSTAFAVAAVNAVSFWRFEPPRVAGCPATTTLQVEVKFTPN